MTGMFPRRPTPCIIDAEELQTIRTADAIKAMKASCEHLLPVIIAREVIA